MKVPNVPAGDALVNPVPGGNVARLHVDDDLVAVDKPGGLLAVPGRSEADCVLARLQRELGELRVVHRLDQATSGVLVFARHAAAQRALAAAFAERRCHKRYVAVVHGSVAQDCGEIDLPLGADWPRRPRQQVDHVRGKPSLTRWRVLERGRATTRLVLTPITGRSHQLRVHLLAIGHPIVGDAIYGTPAARLLLHAWQLTVPHPAWGGGIDFEAVLPF